MQGGPQKAANGKVKNISQRFRGFLPVVVDIESAGFDARKDALLEIAAVLLRVNEQNKWEPVQTVARHVQPFPGANLDTKALEFTGIDPFHPFRLAVPENEALEALFAATRKSVAEARCSRAILVGHNPAFDLAFLQAAVERNKIKSNPFHSFSTFDTASLAGLVYGQTVLAKAVQAAGFTWDAKAAHSAAYDAERTADLFCAMVNRWDELSAIAEREISGG